MKKKTVMTTEKREVWIVRDGLAETSENQTPEVFDGFEAPLPDSVQEYNESVNEEEER